MKARLHYILFNIIANNMFDILAYLKSQFFNSAI